VLQWCRAQGCYWDKDTCRAAASGGHLAMLQWARAQGCPWNEETCWEAAQGGHLNVLRWARGQGCPWDEMTCIQAAGWGHFEVLQWAAGNKCPMGHKTCMAAAASGRLNMLQWAVAQGCPWDAAACLRCSRGPVNLWIQRKLDREKMIEGLRIAGITGVAGIAACILHCIISSRTAPPARAPPVTEEAGEKHVAAQPVRPRWRFPWCLMRHEYFFEAARER